VSTRRVGLSAWQWDKKYGIEYGPNGFRLCRLCKTETTYKRATLCSEACRTRWALMTNPSYARQLVYQRDKGVCALCGLDTDMLLKMIEAPKQAFYNQKPWPRWSDAPLGSFIRRTANNPSPLLSTLNRTASLWDADHIVPVIEGGGECDMDNLRTLCLWCHKAETAALAARRARQRSIQTFAEARAKAFGTTVAEQMSLFSEAAS
jgi:5-methylcytosine-specific restriction protein A